MITTNLKNNSNLMRIGAIKEYSLIFAVGIVGIFVIIIILMPLIPKIVLSTIAGEHKEILQYCLQFFIIFVPLMLNYLLIYQLFRTNRGIVFHAVITYNYENNNICIVCKGLFFDKKFIIRIGPDKYMLINEYDPGAFRLKDAGLLFNFSHKEIWHYSTSIRKSTLKHDTLTKILNSKNWNQKTINLGMESDTGHPKKSLLANLKRTK